MNYFASTQRPDRSHLIRKLLSLFIIGVFAAIWQWEGVLWSLTAILTLERLFALCVFLCQKRKALLSCELQPTAQRNKRVLWIPVLWGAAFLFCVAVRLFCPVFRPVLICLSLLVFAADIVFMHVGCPLKRLFMPNRCCGTCRIYHWNYPMLCTGLAVLIPDFPPASLPVLLSAAIMVLWEAAYLQRGIRLTYGLTLSGCHCGNGLKACRACKNNKINRFGF